MTIKVFDPEINFPKNSVIIADFRAVGYGKEHETIQSKTANKYGIELYPVIGRLNILYLVRNFGDRDWYIDKSLINSFHGYYC